ncbi:glycosyltransferase family 2 protein [Mycoplasma leonicaptivi]|uniref:glycosyltransferase family 2 protein n=1 Tax=Mycoplasma leonicaptivi TaxID=36742 RepID=UPI00047F95DD|nr:glycosyltransferase family 2 protein [Mycoplasma leonicaptivi]
MKLSLISLVSNNLKNIDNYLNSLQQQTNQDFEIILVVSNKTDQKNIFKLIDKYFAFFGQRLVIIYNTKNYSFQYNLLSAFKIAKYPFVTVLNSDTTLKDTYIDKMIESAYKYNVDVLEFKPRLIGSISWKPKARLIDKQVINLENNALPYAYSFPFIFNKIFKKNLIKKISKYKQKIINDSKICLELNYQLLFEAKTYLYLDFRIHREYFGSDVVLNTKTINETFDNLLNQLDMQNRKLYEEVRYAKLYFVKLILTAFLKETTFRYKKLYPNSKEEIKEKRSNLLLEKHNIYLYKLDEEYKKNNYYTSNTYLLQNNPEVLLLLKDVEKLHKTKILKNLE